MGLLEKAYEYKKEINRKGKSTLIDNILGPAETNMMDNDTNISQEIDNSNQMGDEISEEEIFENKDLFSLPEDDDFSPLDALKEQKEKQNRSDNQPWLEDNTNENPDEKQHTILEDIPNPLTPEDDPILPKDIDDINYDTENEFIDTLDTGMDSVPENIEEIPEIEPDIFSDDETETEGDEETAEDPIMNPIGPESGDLGEADNNKTGIDRAENNQGEIQQDHLILYEIEKEIARSETKKALFEGIIFSIMGQIGTSAASIMIRNQGNNWIIADSSGIKPGDVSLTFDSSSGIMKNLKKDIIYIERFKSDPDCNEQYQKLSSIKAKLLIPWTYKGKVLGILALGDKITDEDYTAGEKGLIQTICDASAIELNKINTIEKLRSELETSKSELDSLHHINNIQERIIAKSSIKKIKDIIQSGFDKVGVTSYCIFINDTVKEKYIPVITEKEDYLSLGESEYAIDETSPFISSIKNKSAGMRIENYDKSDIVKEGFDETYIKKMSLLWIYPFEIGNNLIGFISVFKVKEELLAEDKRNDVDNMLSRFSKTLLSNIMNIIYFEYENRYLDNIGIIFKRINIELANSKKLNIPLTLVVFSIKNFKRYWNIFGFEKSKELIDNFVEIIKSRLSETDFSARYDKNKIIVLLPGKDKKFAAIFANTIRNELTQRFKKDEMQLLITYLVSGFPEDGNDLLSLTDNMD